MWHFCDFMIPAAKATLVVLNLTASLILFYIYGLLFYALLFISYIHVWQR